MNEDTVSPFAGNPKTIESTCPDGFPVITVYLRAQTPSQAKLIGTIRKPLALLAASVAGYYVNIPLGGPLDYEQTFFAAACVWTPTYFLPKFLLFKRRIVRLTKDRISIKGGGKWVHYDREREHGFLLMEHPKGGFSVDESDRKYYQPSRRLVFAYYDQLYYVLDIHKSDVAEACVRRIQRGLDHIDGMLRKGSGKPVNPTDEWSVQSSEAIESEH